MPDKGIKFSSLFGPEQVICNLTGVGRDEAIKRLVELVAVTGDLSDIGEAYRLVLAREKLGPTALAPGIVVPHARLEGLPGLHVAVATSREGITFPTPDEHPARLIVLILTPAEDPGGYLQAQAALARACSQHQDIVEHLAALEEPAEVWKAFDQNGGQLSDYVSARDMMNRSYPRLRTSDPLRKAIDEFVRLSISEIPVIDEEGDLAGVVSEDELLRVCLPDYITWMDDLSPILHFEPFAEVLKTEAEAPVVEIMMMSDRYATVEEKTPAVQVAKVMMKREVRQVLVVRGRKLLGVITMQDFINKVMRA